MKKQIFTENFKVLNEFIQKVNDIISPISFRDELKTVMDKTTRKQLSEKYPRCWLPVNISNSNVPFLPICNRNGSTDKRMIAFSMRLANRLLDREDVDRGTLEITIKKLSRMHNTYSREIPTPPNIVARRANITKAMILLKKQLNALRGTDKEDETIINRPPISVP